jgi:hypothetical protein
LRLRRSPCPKLQLCAYEAERSANGARLLLRRQLPLRIELRLRDGSVQLRLLNRFL